MGMIGSSVRRGNAAIALPYGSSGARDRCVHARSPDWSSTDAQSQRKPARVAAEGIALLMGVGLMACAVGANQRWLDRHFLPSFFLPRDWYVAIETTVRLGLAVAGATLAFSFRRRIGRAVGASPATAANVMLAAMLALGASELFLRRVHIQPRSEEHTSELQSLRHL